MFRNMFRGGLRKPRSHFFRASVSSFSLAAATFVKQPREINLYYWDFTFWRAETGRLLLFISGVPFNDIRDASRDKMKAEQKLTFGALPVLEVDGQFLSQSQAIISYCSKLAGMEPVDPWLAAKVDEALNGCTDVTSTIGSTFSLPADQKALKRQELAAEGGRLAMHLGGLEKLARENAASHAPGQMVGAALSAADLAVWSLVNWLQKGVLDGIPKEYVSENFPHLSSVHKRVSAHPKVQEW
eukprot:CAMPEP_0175148836 /NCGR_PEP_ID=MMETSP0087-20121206/16865_1 /TAXON_ID=136419 /ORGANISM="Unknown Unknown, Strain D1" /LENGTH=241 /DNA_ID=CAMNT_0016434373 /DNA_START=16 /DNA_END=738 /DNA_ORIENTATION=+